MGWDAITRWWQHDQGASASCARTGILTCAPKPICALGSLICEGLPLLSWVYLHQTPNSPTISRFLKPCVPSVACPLDAAATCSAEWDLLHKLYNFVTWLSQHYMNNVSVALWPCCCSWRGALSQNRPNHPRAADSWCIKS